MTGQLNISRMVGEQLRALTEINGVQLANRAVEACPSGCTMIFLARSAYQDLLTRSRVPDLCRYKGKTIVVVSDPV